MREWISANDILPRDGEIVVAILATHNYTSMNFCKFKDGEFSIVGVPGNRTDVKYWTSLPWPLPIPLTD